MHARTLAAVGLAIGAALILLGAMLYLNFVSLRDLVLETHISAAIGIVFDTRDEMSHRRAQAFELLTGLVGVAIVLGAAAWLRTGRRGSLE